MNHTKQSVWLDTQTLLLANHPFKTVTINQICAASKIHRSTFYRLFLDKFDLLEFGIAQLWEDYFNCLTFEKLSTPFQTADGFFSFSQAKKLISSQKFDLELLEAIQRLTLNKLKQQYLIYLNGGKKRINCRIYFSYYRLY